MKKTYEKPEIDFVIFESIETIADEGGTIPGLSGDEGYEEW